MAAGLYLDSISKHDLRTLSKVELLMMGSIVISKFAEEQSKRLSNDINDDIPF